MMRSRNLREKLKKRLFRKRVLFKNAAKGFLCPKMHIEKGKYESPGEVQVLKTLISTGDSYFKV